MTVDAGFALALRLYIIISYHNIIILQYSDATELQTAVTLRAVAITVDAAFASSPCDYYQTVVLRTSHEVYAHHCSSAGLEWHCRAGSSSATELQTAVTLRAVTITVDAAFASSLR